MNMRGVELVCPAYSELISGRIRTVADPCGMFCNTPDMRSWKQAALAQIKSTLLGRPDLPEAHRQRLRENAAMIENLAESVVHVGEQTRMLARVAGDAHCLAFWDPATDPPIVPDPPKLPKNPLDDLPMYAGLGLAAILLLRYGRR
jgi:hypothetical protein